MIRLSNLSNLCSRSIHLLEKEVDVFPEPGRTPNTIAFPVRLGTFNALQQSDIHAYWELNPGTNWVFPHYELPFTGGIPGTFMAGKVNALQSVVPGSGPKGIVNTPVASPRKSFWTLLCE